MASDYVRVETPAPHVRLVTLDRPERRNAMAFDVMVPLRRTLEAIRDDNDARVVVLTGAGGAFCAGADLVDAGVPPHIDGLTVPAVARRALGLLDDVVLTLRRLHQPVIAAVDGPAIGGGFCLALAADIRLASPAARFRAAGITNGLTAAELGLSYLLPRAVGSSRAFEIMLSGRDVDGAEAAAIGLVSRVVAPDQLLGACYEVAARLVAFSRIGVETTKRLLWSSFEAGSLAAHMDHESLGQLYVRMTTDNFEEAVRARREDREPQFRDGGGDGRGR